MNGGVALCVEVDPHRIERRLETRYLDEQADDLDDAVARCRAAKAEGRGAVSVGLVGNAAEVLPELLERRLRGRHRHRPDERARPARRLRPRPALARGGRPAAARRPRRVRAPLARRDGRPLRGDGRLPGRAAPRSSTTATACAPRRSSAASSARSTTPGFVPAYVRPLFCEGKGPFRWVALSGDPADIAATDRAVLEEFPDDERLARWIELARRADRLPGPAGADLLARLRRAAPARAALQRDGPRRAS